MRLTNALAAAILACVIAGPAQAADCPAGKSFLEMKDSGRIAIENGTLAELLLLEGESLVGYIMRLNVLHNVSYPLDLDAALIGVYQDGSALFVGFKAGCTHGSGVLGKGVHADVYGEQS